MAKRKVDKIKGGVIIVGSLRWENGINYFKDIDNQKRQTAKELAKRRTEWRNKTLDIKFEEKVKLPIRYGRVSENRGYTYTMVFSRDSLNKENYGLIVPFKRKFDFNINGKLEEQVRAMAWVEGISKENEEWLARNWGTMAIWINPESSDEKRAFLNNQWDLIISNPNYHFLNKPLRPFNRRDNNQYGGSDGVLLDTEFKLTNVPINCNFDFLILIYVKPESNYPNVQDIGQAIKNSVNQTINNSAYSTYFLQNRNKGITTSEDKNILNQIAS